MNRSVAKRPRKRAAKKSAAGEGSRDYLTATLASYQSAADSLAELLGVRATRTNAHGEARKAICALREENEHGVARNQELVQRLEVVNQHAATRYNELQEMIQLRDTAIRERDHARQEWYAWMKLAISNGVSLGEAHMPSIKDIE